MHLLITAAFIAVCIAAGAQSAKILGSFTVPSVSHQVVYRTLALELARRGHEVTIITTDPLREDEIFEFEGKLKQIDVGNSSYKLWNEGFNFAKMRSESPKSQDFYALYKNLMLTISKSQLEHPEIQNILNNESKQFDLLLLEVLHQTNFGYAARFKIPYIGLSSFTAFVTSIDGIGAPAQPALYASIFTLKLGDLSFLERIETFWNDLAVRYIDYIFVEKYNYFIKSNFGKESPPLNELESGMHQLFLNVHPLLAGIRPAPPSLVFLGGVHLKPKKRLPEDLQSFLDEAHEGVVYMSLGSNVKSKDLSPETLKMIVQVFRELPYKVLWKYEEELSCAPTNVKTYSWLPQQDLLDHPNLKAFIMQGGQQSMEEAIRDNVPLIGIPFLADQDLNVQTITKFQVGVGLDLRTLNRQNFKDAILEVAGNEKYKRNMERLRALLADQPMSGAQRAVWWTEYVARHGGARHLRSPAAGVAWPEYFMLDVAAVLLTLVIGALIVTLLFVRTLKLYLSKGINYKKKNQ